VRPRGYLRNYNPREPTLLLLDQVRGVLATYSAELPLTARQIFYRLVATVDFPKTENGYARLQEHLGNFRRAGLIDFADIRDDGTIQDAPFSYASPDDFFRWAEHWAREGQGERQAGQDFFIELWCEAGGMVPQLARAVAEYGVTVYSSGGFDSLTVKYEAAQRIADRGTSTVVIHVGDLDRSGLSLYQAVAEDVTAFVEADSGVSVEFERAALTTAQAERLNLPTAPPKSSDKRFAWTEGGPVDVFADAQWVEEFGTVQAEALPPDVLAREVRAAVQAWIDTDAREEALRAEAGNRRAVLADLRLRDES
jgi:hypothetical protein